MIKKFVIIFSLAITFSNCSSRPPYDVEYFKNGRFVNKVDHQEKTLWSYLLMRMRTTAADWPDKVELKKKEVTPPERSQELRVYYVNHATFLIQYQGINILTDPVFSQRVSPLSWAGPKRVIDPGVPIEEIPPLDYIIISHDHYDHLEVQTLKHLYARFRPKIFLGLGAGAPLGEIPYQEMKWGESYKDLDRSVTVTFTPSQHFSGRGLFDRNSTLWGSFIVSIGDLNLYFAGDTGYSNHFKEISSKYGPIHLSFIPVGAYAPRSFMAYQHMDPKEAIQAHFDLKSEASLGMHWGTFQLTNEGRLEPKEKTEEITKEKGIDNFLVPHNGECFIMVKKKLSAC